MSEVSIDNEAQTAQNGDGQEVRFDPVCIEAPRIYDSCGAKDCLKDLTVFFTAEDQNLVETAASVRVTKASVLTANISERTAVSAAKNPLRLYPSIMPSLPSHVMIEALEKGGVHYGEASRKEAPD